MGKNIYMLITGAFLPHEGRYLRVYNQARALVNGGYHVTILAWDRMCKLPPRVNIDGIDVVRIQHRAPRGVGPRNLHNIWVYNNIARGMLIDATPDCIHCFNIDTIHSGLRASRKLHSNTILDLCEPNYYRGFWKRRYNWLLYFIEMYEAKYAISFDHVFVHNQYQMDKLRASNIQNISKIGSDPNRSSVVQSCRDIKNSERVVIGRLGSIWKNNCIEELLRAIHNINSNSELYELYLAGIVFDNYKEQFAAMQKEYHKYLTVHGSYNIKDVGYIYDSIDVSVIIYNKQQFGNITPTKLFESMAHGVPVVVNDVGEMSEIVLNGNCGVVVDESDDDSICDGIKQICHDPDEYREMSENCIRLISSTYCWEVNQDEFLSVYNNIFGM